MWVNLRHEVREPIYSACVDHREDEVDLPGRVRCLLVGTPRDLRDRRIFNCIALAPLLAWVGLGADGLSSSSYGPDEAFRTLRASEL